MVQQLMAHMVRHEAAQSRGQRNWFSLCRSRAAKLSFSLHIRLMPHVPTYEEGIDSGNATFETSPRECAGRKLGYECFPFSGEFFRISSELDWFA